MGLTNWTQLCNVGTLEFWLKISKSLHTLCPGSGHLLCFTYEFIYFPIKMHKHAIAPGRPWCAIWSSPHIRVNGSKLCNCAIFWRRQNQKQQEQQRAENGQHCRGLCDSILLMVLEQTNGEMTQKGKLQVGGEKFYSPRREHRQDEENIVNNIVEEIRLIIAVHGIEWEKMQKVEKLSM